MSFELSSVLEGHTLRVSFNIEDVKDEKYKGDRINYQAILTLFEKPGIFTNTDCISDDEKITFNFDIDKCWTPLLPGNHLFGVWCFASQPYRGDDQPSWGTEGNGKYNIHISS